MDWLSIFAIAVALAMDAFTVAIVGGLVLDPLTKRQVFRFGFHFGFFQALMPVVGWLAGAKVAPYIAAWDHWVAFALLAFVGARMLLPFRDSKDPQIPDPTRGVSLLILSLATSMDALAVGFSLALLEVRILYPAASLGQCFVETSCIVDAN